MNIPNFAFLWVIHIPRGSFCYICWWHIPERVFCTEYWAYVAGASFHFQEDSNGRGGDRVTQSPEQFSSPDLRILRSKWEQLCKFVLMDKVSIFLDKL